MLIPFSLLIPKIDLTLNEFLILGCFFHMDPHRDWFSTYESIKDGVVKMGNDAQCKIDGKGTIKIKIQMVLLEPSPILSISQI